MAYTVTAQGTVRLSPGSPTPLDPTEVVTFCLRSLTKRSVGNVAGACMACWADEARGGRVLRLVDDQGETLIDPALDIRIDPQAFRLALMRVNLLAPSRVT
jgi:hypothetical protein